jgi:hypothetical protein
MILNNFFYYKGYITSYRGIILKVFAEKIVARFVYLKHEINNFILFYFFNCFIIHMCIQGLGHFSPLPPPLPLPPTLPPSSAPHPLEINFKSRVQT